MTLRALYRTMTPRDLRTLRTALQLDAHARRGDRRVQAFTAYRVKVIGQVLRDKR